jgi:hypothetical protein
MLLPPLVTCSNCGLQSPVGTQYCPRCGEAVDPRLVEELRWLYGALGDLEARIARGEGERSIHALRDEYRDRYLALSRRPSVAVQAPLSVPRIGAVAPTVPPPAPPPVWRVPLPPTPQPSGPAMPPTRPRAAQEAVAFSWSAFLADQAIAILAYLGGFLLLVATLTFEVGAWQVSSDAILNDRLKLITVGAVYVVFAVLGLWLRRLPHLRTVGGAYLGVFALMTPLVALAAYLNLLRGLGVAVMGMLSISAFYATAVYLALAWRTRFATYAYIGWVSILVGALAIVQWANAAQEWSFFALGAVSLVLLVPQRLRRFEAARMVAVPALHLSVLTSLAAAFTTAVLGLVEWTTLATLVQPGGGYSTAALACAAVALAALAAGWSVTVRALERRPADAVLDALDALVTVAGAFAALSLAIWAGAGVPELALLLAGIALIEFGGGAFLHRLRPRRATLRHAIQGLGLGMASLGALTVFLAASPNWPLLAALGAGAFVAAGIAIEERTPAWLLAAGPFLLVGMPRVADVVRDGPLLGPLTDLRPELAHTASFYTALALALAVGGLALAARPATRAYARPLYAIALVAALIATALLPISATFGQLVVAPQADYQTTVLALFTAAALLVGARERLPVATGVTVGLFGLLLPLPYVLNSGDGVPASLLALGSALLALALRRTLGRRWALPLYGVTLWVTLLAVRHDVAPEVNTAGWAWLGVAFAAWLVLALAVLATVAALLEGVPTTTIAPAVLALGAVILTSDTVARTALMFALFAAGAALRQARGRGWGLAWYSAGALASLIAVPPLDAVGVAGTWWQVGVLLALTALIYLLAAWERLPWGTALAAFYGLWAAVALPRSTALSASIVLTFAAAGLAALLRLRAGRDWALAVYTIALGASALAALRLIDAPYDPNSLEALLLAFVAVSCVLAAIDRAPVAGVVPALYAIWAVFAEPDTRFVLGLALLFALVGLALGRVANAWWALPWYAVAAVAGAATGVRGLPDPGFEALALLALAVVVYIVAVVESLPDLLPLALLLGALSLGAAADYAQLDRWQAVLALVGLSYVYAAGEALWRVVPGLRPRSGGTLSAGGGLSAPPPNSAVLALEWLHRDPRTAGAAIHRWGSLLLAVGAIVVAIFTLDSFSPFAPGTQVVGAALLATGGLLALQARLTNQRAQWYLAGLLVALAVTWEGRWLGADNIQAFVLAPGSYLLLIGALLPGDKQVRQPVPLGPWASLLGALLLLIPTLYQALTSGEELLYGTVLALYGLVVVGIGVGIRARTLVLLGTGFVGFAAIRGALLAVSEGVPIAVILAAFAALLLGGALWLSLRARRRDQGTSGPSDGVTTP